MPGQSPLPTAQGTGQGWEQPLPKGCERARCGLSGRRVVITQVPEAELRK